MRYNIEEGIEMNQLSAFMEMREQMWRIFSINVEDVIAAHQILNQLLAFSRDQM